MDFRKVGGQEEDQKLLGEGQSRKNETKLGGRAGKWPAKVVAQDRKCWSDSVEALCDKTYDDDDTPYFKASANVAVLLS